MSKARALLVVSSLLLSSFFFSDFARAETVEGRLNRAAYPLAKFAGKYEALSSAEEAEIRARIAQALTPIRLAPLTWFRASFGLSPTIGDAKRILASIDETEIWKCGNAECRGCPGDDQLGCAMGTPKLGGTGVVMIIHPCLVGEGKCPRSTKPDSEAWIQKVIPTIAFYKSGASKLNDGLHRAQKASREWVDSTSRAVNQLLGACPGPYSSESLKFLKNLDSISLPNPALKNCGRSYWKALRELPEKCGTLRTRDQAEWNQLVSAKLSEKTQILRCDAFCRKLLCRSSAAKTAVTAFSGTPTLVLFDGACEGETARDIPAFLREALPKALRSKLEISGCLPAVAPSVSERSSDSSGERSDGPEVQLVE